MVQRIVDFTIEGGGTETEARNLMSAATVTLCPQYGDLLTIALDVRDNLPPA